MSAKTPRLYGIPYCIVLNCSALCRTVLCRNVPCRTACTGVGSTAVFQRYGGRDRSSKELPLQPPTESEPSSTKRWVDTHMTVIIYYCGEVCR